MDVAVFVVDGVADFGLAAVLEAFSTANSLVEEFDPAPAVWRIQTVSLGDSVRSGHGHTVPTTRLANMSAGIDLIIVPAVLVFDAESLIRLVSAPAGRPVLERILRARTEGASLAAACTGTFFLAEAGVLDGVQATTSWWLGPAFRNRYPRIVVDEGPVLCRAGRITTAGAALSHLDLALSLIAARSPALAELTSRYLVAGYGRTQIEFAVPEVIARGDSLVAAFERWIRDHIAEQFQITDAARQLNVTPRSLQRATRTEIGMSPTDFVNEIRLQRATHLLRTTALTIDSVAAKVGYLNAGTLRSLFRRRRGRTIADVRSSPLTWDSASIPDERQQMGTPVERHSSK
ncbi:helix-turn-helix domain-containing protein [Nocardia uniformis]|uniref:Helix-turn-helix domain-containing protein n=1 Tax=Nocardia uniformis TaxID=53432 RepID=A0A849C3I5_9NOCA|nr:helix-turn-helix domain-containing protein [Nocardia uniformis]NNH73222.1 helix-turn-helix domain-containing protein [Nocardia uniformis]